MRLNLNSPFSPAIMDVEDELRPRVARKLGLPLEWDLAVDSLAPPKFTSLANMSAHLCRLYRRVRPRSIGNRCAFEPSCSRYAELCFRTLGFWKGMCLTVNRLRRCSGRNGGLDLPPNTCGCPSEISGDINEVQNRKYRSRIQ